MPGAWGQRRWHGIDVLTAKLGWQCACVLDQPSTSSVERVAGQTSQAEAWTRNLCYLEYEALAAFVCFRIP